MALEWKHPFTANVCGPSGSGKSSFVLKFIDNVRDIMSPPPKHIVWCYGVYQSAFNSVRNVEFHEGLPDAQTLKPDTLLILDDLMHEADSRVDKIFTKHSHHMGISVMFLTQNLFHKGARTMTLNAHYLVIFKNPRDKMQITHLARQMYPGRSKFVTEAFEDATAKPYSYLVVDLKADTEEKMRLRSGIFPGEDNTPR